MNGDEVVSSRSDCHGRSQNGRFFVGRWRLTKISMASTVIIALLLLLGMNVSVASCFTIDGLIYSNKVNPSTFGPNNNNLHGDSRIRCCDWTKKCSTDTLMYGNPLNTILNLLTNQRRTRQCLHATVSVGDGDGDTIVLPPPARLRQMLEKVHTSKFTTSGSITGNDNEVVSDFESKILLLPCCYDGISAKLIAQSGFDATFMTGFGVSAVRGYPDTQLVSYNEMLSTASIISEALTNSALELNQRRRIEGNSHIRPPIPCIADGDTGYGNAMNVKRTVHGYARAGMAGIMIEDQLAPKRCGHVSGKTVIPLRDAIARVQAACDARDEYEELHGPGTGPLVVARTDALKVHGFQAAIERCQAFRSECNCDVTFLEAPESIEQMIEYCRTVPGYKLANMLEQGTTPILTPQQLQSIGYTMAAYPLTLLSASIRAMQLSLDRIKNSVPTDDIISTFETTKDVVGFTQYAIEEQKYKID